MMTEPSPRERLQAGDADTIKEILTKALTGDTSGLPPNLADLVLLLYLNNQVTIAYLSTHLPQMRNKINEVIGELTDPQTETMENPSAAEIQSAFAGLIEAVVTNWSSIQE